MPYGELPEFIAKLREAESIQALALEFLILTAGRAGEVLGATWDEIDIDAKVWVIPAFCMKAGCLHRVPRSARALAILERMAEIRTGELVFPGRRRRRPYPNTSLGKRACTGRQRPTVFDRPSGIGRAKKQASRARSPSRHWRTQPATLRSALTGVAMRWKSGAD